MDAVGANNMFWVSCVANVMGALDYVFLLQDYHDRFCFQHALVF